MFEHINYENFAVTNQYGKQMLPDDHNYIVRRMAKKSGSYMADLILGEFLLQSKTEFTVQADGLHYRNSKHKRVVRNECRALASEIRAFVRQQRYNLRAVDVDVIQAGLNTLKNSAESHLKHVIKHKELVAKQLKLKEDSDKGYIPFLEKNNKKLNDKCFGGHKASTVEAEKAYKRFVDSVIKSEMNLFIQLSSNEDLLLTRIRTANTVMKNVIAKLNLTKSERETIIESSYISEDIRLTGFFLCKTGHRSSATLFADTTGGKLLSATYTGDVSLIASMVRSYCYRTKNEKYKELLGVEQKKLADVMVGQAQRDDKLAKALAEEQYYLKRIEKFVTREHNIVIASEKRNERRKKAKALA